MATVNPVDYIKPSSSSEINKFDQTGDGIPDQVVFNETNKNAIYKDAQAGNVKLSVVQQGWIDKHVNPDEVNYSEEEIKANGASAINTKGEDGESLTEKDENGGAIGATVSAGTAAAGATISAIGSLLAITKNLLSFTKASAMPACGWMSVVGGGVCAAAGIATLALSFGKTFDSNLGEREAQTAASENNNNVITTRTADLEERRNSMAEDSQRYLEACENYTNDSAARMDEIGTLQSQKIQLESQGNFKQAQPIQDQIDVLYEEAEGTSGAEEEMNTCRANLESNAAYGTEAEGVKESGTVVSEFLKAGKPMKNMATANMWTCYAGAAMALVSAYTCAAINGVKLTNPFTWWEGPMLAVAFGLNLAGAATMIYAATNFDKHAKTEGTAADAGENMKTNVDALGNAIKNNSDAIDECAGTYASADADASQTLDGIQGGIDNSNKQLKENLDEKPVKPERAVA